MNYDDLLAQIGNFSTYQLRNYILLCIPVILCAFHKLSSVFILGKMSHRCQLQPEEPPTASFSLPYEILNHSYPFDSASGRFSNCSYFTDHYYATNQSEHIEKTCPGGYIWDDSKFQSSALMEFELVCDRGYYKAMSDSLFMIGVFMGSFVFGFLSDIYGRRKVFVLSLISQLIFGILTAFATNFVVFTIFRMVVGATTSGVFLVAYCLSLEMFGKELRMQAGVCFMMFFSCGYMIMGVINFFVTDWRLYQIAITLPGLIFLAYWFVIPESIRWLLTKNKKQKALIQIQKIADSNKVELPKELLEKFIESEVNEDGNEGGAKSSVLDLFRQPHLRTKAVLIFMDWFVVSGAYYGLSWSSGDLVSGNPRLNHILSGAVEIPGYIILLLTLNRYGRKKILAGNLTFAGLMLLTSLVVPQDINWLVITLTMLGKMSITASYGTIYLFSVEQFPTVIRNVALGMCSMSARLGATLSPFIILSGDTWKPLPFLIFGIGAFVGGFLSTFLPETYKQDLPDTIHDAEKLGQQNNNVEQGHQEELHVLNKSNTAK